MSHDARYLYRCCLLPQIRWSPLLVLPSTPSSASPFSSPDIPGARSSGSYILSSLPNSNTTLAHPITSVLSSLHRSDLLLLCASSNSTASGAPLSKLASFPVSPYPAQPGTPIRAHFHSATRPQLDGDDGEGWEPWIGGSWAKWVKGAVLGYRDFTGREAQVRLSPRLFGLILIWEPLHRSLERMIR